jgi:hypothetical protein
VAKPNYAFEKRQRELAKKKKKEEKAARKSHPREAGGEPAEATEAEPGTLPQEGGPEAVDAGAAGAPNGPGTPNGPSAADRAKGPDSPDDPDAVR